MIAQAFDTDPRCTCQLAFAGDMPLTCPVHGATFGPLPRPPGAIPAPEQARPAPEWLAEVHTAEFTRGRERGFREGIEAAMKMMGVK